MSAFCILYWFFSFGFILDTLASTSKFFSHHMTWKIFLKGFLSFSPTQLCVEPWQKKKKQAQTWNQGWNKLLWILQSYLKKKNQIIHQSICDHVVNKMFIGCKDMVKYCSFYFLLLWQSASWFENKKKKRTKFKMNSNKTVKNVLDKWGHLIPLRLFGHYFWCLCGSFVWLQFFFSGSFFYTKTCFYWIGAINYSKCSTEKCKTSELFQCNIIMLLKRCTQCRMLLY